MTTTTDLSALKHNLKLQVIQQLNLEGKTPEDIGDDMSLFGDGLGLDSIDALELIVLLDRHYGIRLASTQKGRDVFQSINTMAAYIQANS